jgi:hypothetical protein
MGDRATKRTRRRWARAAGTAVAAGLLAAGAAGCEPAPTVLEVTYRDGRGGSLTYTVSCGPDAAATISPAVAGLDARRACAVVDSERSLLVDGPPDDRYCAQQHYGPQNARLTGHIDDDPVDQTFRRNDACVEYDWRRVGALVQRPPAGAS